MIVREFRMWCPGRLRDGKCRRPIRLSRVDTAFANDSCTGARRVAINWCCGWRMDHCATGVTEYADTDHAYRDGGIDCDACCGCIAPTASWAHRCGACCRVGEHQSSLCRPSAGPGAKHERARTLIEELWRDRSGVVSTQVLQELSVNLRRKAGQPLDVKATRDIVADYLTWQVVVNGGESILEALDLESRYRISFWDALVIQAAQASGAEVLYSEDLSDGQMYGSVRVVNPLQTR